jgi:hypothetical protein
MQDMPGAVKRIRGTLAAVLLLVGTAPAVAGPVDDTPVLSLPTAIGAVDYTPGRGLRVGDTGLTIGGYTNLNVTRDEGGPARFSFDDLSFFVTWDPIARLHLFSELEFEDLVDIDDHGRQDTTDRRFTAERLYGDFTLADWLNLRIGKFLTPVGRWNVIHAQPLVWTTSRPLVTELPFDPHTTGAMLFGSLFPGAGALTYQLYGQFTDQFDAVPTFQPAERSGGARLEYERGDWSIGGSYLRFSDRPTGHWRHLTGVDGLWRRERFELMGEATYEEPTDGPGRQWGLYLQAVEEVFPRVYLVERYEHFEVSGSQAANLFVPGLAFKPVPYIVLKGEYLIADHRVEESPPGFKASFAILF